MENMPLSFDMDVKGKFISVVRSSNGWSKSNRYDRFAVLTGQKPVEEFVKTGMPDFITCNYKNERTHTYSIVNYCIRKYLKRSGRAL